MHPIYRSIGSKIAKKMYNGPIERLALTQRHLSTGVSSTNYSSIIKGAKYTPDYRNYLKLPNGDVGSFFHDVPIDFNKLEATLNIVVEIPRWTNGKFEINTKLPGNPITQDIKNNKVRFVNNIFPHHGYMHNYGAIPQTWEDPTVKNEELDLYGDGDPLDVIEIGSEVLGMGSVKRVKVLGSLALIDDGELDWKIVVIDVEDPLVKELNDIYDVYHVLPGLLEDTRQWFKNYKKPTGKPENKFAFNGEFKNQDTTIAIIEECFQSWKSLINKQKNVKLSIANSTLKDTPEYGKLDLLKSLASESIPDAAIPQEVNKSYYYQL